MQLAMLQHKIQCHNTSYLLHIYAVAEQGPWHQEERT